jgi:hypothetical protein
VQPATVPSEITVDHLRGGNQQPVKVEEEGISNCMQEDTQTQEDIDQIDYLHEQAVL